MVAELQGLQAALAQATGAERCDEAMSGSAVRTTVNGSDECETADTGSGATLDGDGPPVQRGQRPGGGRRTARRVGGRRRPHAVGRRRPDRRVRRVRRRARPQRRRQVHAHQGPARRAARRGRRRRGAGRRARRRPGRGSATCRSAAPSTPRCASAASTSCASAWTGTAGACRCPALALTPHRATPAQARVDEVIELVGASAYAHRPIGECSGGEQQRLLIAQALVRRPRLLLLDEPLDSLDLPNQASVAALIGRIIALGRRRGGDGRARRQPDPALPGPGRVPRRRRRRVAAPRRRSSPPRP